MTALIVPLGRPSTSRKTISTGRSMHPLLESLLEHQLEGEHQVLPRLVRVAVGELEVEQVPELDRLGGALVGHSLPLNPSGCRIGTGVLIDLTFVPPTYRECPAAVNQLESAGESARYASIISKRPAVTEGRR